MVVILNQKTTANSVQLDIQLAKGIYFITIKGEQIEQTQTSYKLRNRFDLLL